MNSSPIILSLLLITLHFLSFTSNSFLFQTTQIRGSLYEEKTRLGSTPPSCHNKCNLCHPCMAVQVPTVPGVRPPGTAAAMEYYDRQPTPSSLGNRYSNYKPLGWKCRCGGHFYNP
ncbi:EPIDERMAL PATTERNING FACTOR-like protein 1 isoform X2 [Cynara cardunculus var. scolymus]|uniref:EPIDERMAL PATTERNING FACTOR-like protein 1 isoform X2 n=1 Tax=Cynara cardunculus var. scolymus TaxID=59895 RepID=UPI000D6298FE|nr:EPIDERMAL PATTERNING FACTOR-like protein 1 isoform X2 [Cynara cardunculus var. scolymus]